MFRSEARSRRHFLLTMVLSALLVVIFAVPGSAEHPGSGGIHTLAPMVQDRFFGSVPPRDMKCTWRHSVNAYVCERENGGRGRWQLSATNDEGLLRSGGGETVYQPANPEVFRCNRPEGGTKPSDYSCNYSLEHNGTNYAHAFRLDEMIVVSDPADNDNPHNLAQIFYAWPPHKE
jgi:hypothetical protein